MENYETLPEGVKDIIDTWDDNKNLYDECSRIQSELNQVGWTCDYDLSGEVFDVEPI